MNPQARETTRSLRSLDALLQLREKQNQDAGVKLRRKHMQISRVERELAYLKKRRDNVIRRGGAQVLRERLLLDALMTIVLERQQELQALRADAAELLEGYRETRSRRDIVESLHERQRTRMEVMAERRTDEAAADLAATRKFREGRPYQEESCED